MGVSEVKLSKLKELLQVSKSSVAELSQDVYRTMLLSPTETLKDELDQVYNALYDGLEAKALEPERWLVFYLGMARWRQAKAAFCLFQKNKQEAFEHLESAVEAYKQAQNTAVEHSDVTSIQVELSVCARHYADYLASQNKPEQAQDYYDMAQHGYHCAFQNLLLFHGVTAEYIQGGVPYVEPMGTIEESSESEAEDDLHVCQQGISNL